MRPANSIKKLLVSNTRLRLVQQLFYDPTELRYIRDLTRSTNQEINAVRRELVNLKSADFVKSETRGNRVYYWANPESDLYFELILLSHKTSRLGANIYKSRDRLGKINFLMFSPHYLLKQKDAPDEIDFVLVGKINLAELEPIIKEEEKLLGRELNYMVMDKSELQIRRSRRDPFLVDFLLHYPAVIIGSSFELTNL